LASRPVMELLPIHSQKVLPSPILVFWRETQTFTTEESRLQTSCDHEITIPYQRVFGPSFFYLNRNKKMKTFKQFILEAEYRPVNARQTIPLDQKSQAALNAARSGEGKKLQPIKFSLQTVQQLK
jgi:hypothetical protein